MAAKTFDLTSGQFKACLFDMDGVLTDTASTHATAWKATFDEFLQRRADEDGTEFLAFDIAGDYHRHVDGKARAQGVRDFLASRGITLEEGNPDDDGSSDTVNGLGNRKNELVLRLIADRGADVYATTVELVHRARELGLKTAVVSASANAPAILDKAGIANLFDTRVDGNVARERKLPGKPAPDTFLEAAKELSVAPSEAIVFEDAISGVAAGKAGDFGLVVGIDRVGQRLALLENGADLVVADLGELLS
jgi:beta-phosphoglucomutase family hydrolase